MLHSTGGGGGYQDSSAACIRSRTAAISASFDTNSLGQPWKFCFGEHVISNLSRAPTFRHMCVNHLIHHTAQLGIYLRLLDLPVPALYGPSADEQWFA